ncbi:tRNA (adenosine(37)-N6)-threonylcarbamoyltransferase complex transferase subunit TsaD [Rubeoparvulum massiliense]|uniref:tRNA (adenosine(37)-N6)-threonylcarbamoyltransferase complex transferase subunit TsaD n=1 Tax=Rubeoparvulum massiliense TaxID=1631346 RepID=UPI00065E9135|nr:tRNA (adenosine(37)-N6)-threonylcarbamoyltransferase complex transferase subunit TsaD [Rubeoparvulum massiliense]
MSRFILGIETSCDETAAAVVKDGREICSNIIHSQIAIHERFGGVVPEVASRHHVGNITWVIERALREAGKSIDEMDAVAVTQGPGLVGSLLVGLTAAKTLAFAHGRPLIGVHHIAGHIYANRLVKEMQFPLIALVVSGGHTELLYMPEHGVYRLLGQTRDDAAGEAYDKVARSLQLTYPGGPKIDRLAQQAEPLIHFPRAWLEADSYDFSFSGLKSAVINHLHNAKQRGDEVDVPVLAASFQDAVVDVLVTKAMRAVDQYQVHQLVLAGGVAANQGLRKRLEAEASQRDLELLAPPIALCTDNGAMIAAAGTISYERGEFSSYDINAIPQLLLPVEKL